MAYKRKKKKLKPVPVLIDKNKKIIVDEIYNELLLSTNQNWTGCGKEKIYNVIQQYLHLIFSHVCMSALPFEYKLMVPKVGNIVRNHYKITQQSQRFKNDNYRQKKYSYFRKTFNDNFPK